MNRQLECVPNFSEGNNANTLEAIAQAIRSVNDVRLLNIDPGKGANRTVMTFVGPPESVVEAAFRMTRTAAQHIDMRQQHGTHPRIGATDVLPLVPVSGITLAEAAHMATALATRIAQQLHIPCYLYEAAARITQHRDLAFCRIGEYEGLPQRLASADPLLMPDLGCRPWDEQLARTGCTVVGARPFLIAVNFNLNTADTAVATSIARAVRQRGYQGMPGTLPGTKAIGWYIPEYGFAQVSMNICDTTLTPLHRAYAEVCRQAASRGVSVTGTEIIGLVPRESLLSAGRWFLSHASEKNTAVQTAVTDEATLIQAAVTHEAAPIQSAVTHEAAPIQSAVTDEATLIQAAVSAMGLEQLSPFHASQRVIG